MPGGTEYLSLPYPLPGEVFQRQHIEDLADALDFVLSANNVGRVAALQRTKGVLGSTAANVFVSDTPGYMSWNVDHLDNWSNGGRAITATQGPTLATGLYLFCFSAVRTAISGIESAYPWTTADFERGGGIRYSRRTFNPGQRLLRLSAPVRIPAGAAQQVRVRVQVNGNVVGSTMTYGRDLSEAAPRLSWVQLTTG